MGLFDIFRSHSVTESTVTGVAIGAYVGDKLDERRDRGHIISLLEAGIAQREYHYAIDKLLNPPVSFEEAMKTTYDGWFWVWEPPDVCAKFHIDCMCRSLMDDAFSRERTQLYNRWKDVRARALVVGIIPTVRMPRSVSGDIAGTPDALTRAMDKILDDTEILERGVNINTKWDA